MNLLPLGILLVVGSGALAGFVTYENWDTDRRYALDACTTTPLTEPSSREGLIRYHLTNMDDEGKPAVLCVMNGKGEKVAHREVFVARDGIVEVDLEVPVGAFTARVEHPDGGAKYASGAGNYLAVCPKLAYRVHEDVGNGPGDSRTTGCFDPGTGRPQQEWIEYAWSMATGMPETKAATVGVATTMVGGLILGFRVPLHYGSLLLFTRLKKPTILEQERRGQIHDLVESQPGIHAAAIATSLELARGETQYHLHVLVREGLLSRVTNWGQKSFFLAGKYAPWEMRARAALRSKPLERVYEAIRINPGVPLSDIAHASGFSLGRASRIARRLEEAGLVDRTEKGRSVHYSARNLATLVPSPPTLVAA